MMKAIKCDIAVFYGSRLMPFDAVDLLFLYRWLTIHLGWLAVKWKSCRMYLCAIIRWLTVDWKALKPLMLSCFRGCGLLTIYRMYLYKILPLILPLIMCWLALIYRWFISDLSMIYPLIYPFVCLIFSDWRNETEIKILLKGRVCATWKIFELMRTWRSARNY